MKKSVTSESFQPDLIINSPGRINLIGEHTDYNMGFVFPAAIDRRIEFRIRKNDEKHICNVYSADFKKLLTFTLEEVTPSEEEWENYILGVIHEIQKLGHQFPGFDCQLHSDLPIGAGISSSAAMECGIAFAINDKSTTSRSHRKGNPQLVFFIILEKGKLLIVSVQSTVPGALCGFDQHTYTSTCIILLSK